MKNGSDGMIMISILMVSVILTMITTSLVVINYYNNEFTSITEGKSMALKVAESGIAYAIYRLNENPAWNTPVNIPMLDVPGRFQITFDNTADYYSVNNLRFGARDGGWGGVKVPGFSVDLIVTGIVKRGGSNVTKRIRVILQRDFNYPGAFSSGQTVVDADTFDVRKETTADNPSEAGTLHSNSVKTDIMGSAIKTFKTGKTNVFLHGGIASANGHIDIKTSGLLKNLDTDNNSSVDPVTHSKNVKPVDIERTVEKAKNTLPAASKVNINGNTTYVIYKDRVEPALPSSLCEVTNGQLHIKDDILFNANGNDVKFELDYSYANPSSTEYDPNINIALSGIYLEGTESHIPALYVDGGNLIVSGPARGNGSVYITGEGTFIGESNIVGPEDPGVALMASEDLTMKLPSSRREELNIDITGLVYSNENINMDILKPEDPLNPANNVSAGTQWPSEWEDIVFSKPSGDTLSLPFQGTDATYGLQQITLNGSTGSYIKRNVDINGTETFTVHGLTSCTIKIGTVNYAYGAPGGSMNVTLPGDIAMLSGGDYGGLADEAMNIIRNEFQRRVNAGEGVISSPVDPNAVKIDPAFHVTGGVVAIDPNNPVPTVEKPDTDDAGNININIKQGKFFIISSQRYLKLLESAKAEGGSFKTVLWGEI
ncbi:MAG: hypothetical protein ABRQ39_05370 [Candidatus Eremiobacterota bacterium]